MSEEGPYYLHKAELYKTLFDHVKSFWALPLGGLAASIALLAVVAKELPPSLPHNPSQNPYVWIVAAFLAAGLLWAVFQFISSIRICVNAQYDIIEIVTDSENTAHDKSKEYGETEQEEFKGRLDKIRESIKKGKGRFYQGAICIILSSFLLFADITWTSWIKPKPQSTHLQVKSVVITTMDGKQVELMDVSLDMPFSAADQENIQLLVNPAPSESPER